MVRPRLMFLSADGGPLPEVARSAGLRSLRLVEQAVRQESGALLDTFDGLIYRSGAYLQARHEGGKRLFELISLEGHTIACAPVAKRAAFAVDLPCGELREQLSQRAGVRRLLTRARLDTSVIEYRVLDGLDKTVARVAHTCGTIAANQADGVSARLPHTVSLLPLRGFEQQGEVIAAALSEGSWSRVACPYPHWMSAAGLAPEGDAPKHEIALDGAGASIAGVCHVLKSYQHSMRINESGTREDVDAEFLHDFRVAVRRTRSLMARMKKVFDARRLQHFRAEFSWLGALTGPTRDLDVYLLGFDGYRVGLSEAENQALDVLQRFLRKDKSKEQRLLARGLASARYVQLQQDWGRFIADAPNGTLTKTAGQSLQQVANGAIGKQLQRVRKLGRSITPDTPAAAVHALRIECKKLRYLLEAFGSLYGGAESKALTSALKRLQTTLGDFNDYEVQVHRLRDFAARMAASQKSAVPYDTFMVMGRLVERLQSLQGEAREEFHERWRQFDSKKHAAYAACAFADAAV